MRHERGQIHVVHLREIALAERLVLGFPHRPRYGAARIRRLRTMMGLSQAVFASALNVSRETVRAWDRGSASPRGRRCACWRSPSGIQRSSSMRWRRRRATAADDRSRYRRLVDGYEIHKIPTWSETVKRLLDEDTRARRPLRVVLLGSVPLLIGRGLTESLAGRFETLHLPHWSFSEMRDAFGWSLDEYLFYGGYPGAAPLIGEPARWSRYLADSLIETSIARDVLLLTRVDKPGLLRRLFELACPLLRSGPVLHQDARPAARCRQHVGAHEAISRLTHSPSHRT
jgi:hypothetical protein